MSQLIDPRVAAARARAAIGFSRLEHGEIAERSGLSVAMIRRIASKKTPRDGTIERLWAIANACGVPREFMEHGWDYAMPTTDITSRLDELVETVSRLDVRLAEQERLREVAEGTAVVEEHARDEAARSAKARPQP